MVSELSSLRIPNLAIFKKQNLNYLLFVIIILVALFLRLYNLEYMEFKGDEAFNSFKALKMVENGEIPLTSSKSITGINEPPIFIYLLAIPFLFTNNPVVAAGFIAIMNVIGIIICFFFLKKFADERSALIATAFYAVNPWQILFSRKIWTQNLLAPFIMLFIYFMFNAVYDKKRRQVIPAMIALGFIVQLHLSAAYFIGVFTFSIIWYRERLNWKYIGIGGILFLMMFAPYFFFQFQNSFIDYHGLSSYLDRKSAFQVEAFNLPFLLATTKGFDYSFGEPSYRRFLDSTTSTPLLDLLPVVILFFSIIFLHKAWGDKGIILYLGISLGALFISLSRTKILNHYFLSILPLIFILKGTFLGWLSRKGTKVLTYGIFGITIILMIYQFSFDLQLLNFVKEETCISGDYGQPYVHRYKIIKETVNPLDIETITRRFDDIHASTCTCTQCYRLVTKYIIKMIKPEYQVALK
jgi:4-amino-4-deoxy-L-arabinose transferase-like glycosyltransferase